MSACPLHHRPFSGAGKNGKLTNGYLGSAVASMSSTDAANPAATLDKEIEQSVRELCAEGYSAYDNGDTKTALRQFYRAWTLLPKPQSQWEAAGWVLTAIGDTYFAQRNWSSGIEALRSATHCPGARGNPFIHLRLGQCLYESGELDLARNEFLRVKDHGGGELLTKEDNKYRELLETN